MINKGDIKDLILILLVIGTAVGISAVIEYAFHAYVYGGTNTVEEQQHSEVQQHAHWDSSYCRTSFSVKTGVYEQWNCRKITTPKLIQLLRGSKMVAKV